MNIAKESSCISSSKNDCKTDPSVPGFASASEVQGERRVKLVLLC